MDFSSIIFMRRIFFLVLAGAHLALGTIGPDILAPVVASSVYLPLGLLHQIGLPVFGVTESGGWPPPSMFGWVVVLTMWAAIWWRLAFLLAFYIRKRKIEY